MIENVNLYIKGEQLVEVVLPKVTLGDLLDISCPQEHIANQVKQIPILKFPKNNYQRTVVSILKIIERIHEKFPQIQVENYGAVDIIVAYENEKTPSKLFHILKGFLIIGITFFGSAYSIMAFSNDVDTLDIFDQLYILMTGTQADGFNILQFSYCIGLAVGILVFFNHFGKKKFMVDPTPMEIEMRLYEQDIQTTLIQSYGRCNQEVEVGDPNTLIDHRHQ